MSNVDRKTLRELREAIEKAYGKSIPLDQDTLLWLLNKIQSGKVIFGSDKTSEELDIEYNLIRRSLETRMDEIRNELPLTARVLSAFSTITNSYSWNLKYFLKDVFVKFPLELYRNIFKIVRR